MDDRIKSECADCGKKFSVSRKFAGKRIKCPACGAAVLIAPATSSLGTDDSALANSAFVNQERTRELDIRPSSQQWSTFNSKDHTEHWLAQRSQLTSVAADKDKFQSNLQTGPAGPTGWKILLILGSVFAVIVLLVAIIGFGSWAILDNRGAFESPLSAREEIIETQAELKSVFASIDNAENARAAISDIERLLKQHAEQHAKLLKLYEESPEDHPDFPGVKLVSTAQEKLMQDWAKATPEQNVPAAQMAQWQAIRQQQEAKKLLGEQWVRLAKTPEIIKQLLTIENLGQLCFGVIPNSVSVKKIRKRLALKQLEQNSKLDIESQEAEATRRRLATPTENNKVALERARSIGPGKIITVKATSGLERLAELRFQLELALRAEGSDAQVELGGDTCIIAPVKNDQVVHAAVHSINKKSDGRRGTSLFSGDQWLGTLERFDEQTQTFYLALKPDLSRFASFRTHDNKKRWLSFKAKHPDSLQIHITGATRYRKRQLFEQTSDALRELGQDKFNVNSDNDDIWVSSVNDVQTFFEFAQLGRVTQSNPEDREFWIQARSE